MTAAADHASISVVIPTFNDVGRIGDALASIVGQTLPPAEIVVCDDGSDDGTEKFVREFASKHAHEVDVRYVRLPARSGAWAARNKAIELARCDWVANCDSDDVWAPTKLERQTDFIRGWSGRQRIALLGTYGFNMNDAKRVLSPAVMGPTTEQEYLALKRSGELFYVIHSSALFTRSDFLAVGGYSSEYGAADDYPFFCAMAERGVVLNLPEPLVYYRKRAGSVQIDRFWDLLLNIERLAENQRRRAVGQSPVSRDEFVARIASGTLWERFKRRKRLWGMYYYRRGATNVANDRRVRGAAELVLASVMDWGRVRAGVLNVVRGASLRNLRKRAGV
jgi:glycosyltransferase involved in cell wall biosynthesis